MTPGSHSQSAIARHRFVQAVADVLAVSREAAMVGDFYVMPHALQRQEERSVARADLLWALRTARAAYYRGKHRWRLEGGRDLDGDPLTVVVEIRTRLVVITVY